MLITEDITIEELVERIPKSVSILMDYGIICIKCGEPVWGTLKEQFDTKGITNRSEILEKINSIK